MRIGQTEASLRAIAEQDLRQRYPAGRIIHELVLRQGTCRIDLACVTEDHISLVEIKSDFDVVDRLEAQLKHANWVTHDVAVYAGYKLRDKVEEVCAGAKPDPIRRFYENGLLMPGRSNNHEFYRRWRSPDNLHLNSRRLFHLLWREEMEQVLRRNSIGLPPKGNQNMISYTGLAIEHLTGRQIRREVCRQLRARIFARADEPINV